MKTKHTPAPWEIKGSIKDGDFWINGESHNYDTVIVANPDFIVSEANARLISAAPALLECLIMSLDYDMTEVEIAHWEQKARSAISKATGG